MCSRSMCCVSSLSVFSFSSAQYTVRACKHGWGITSECVCKWGTSESKRAGAQEACSCMTQLPHGTLALALLTTSLQAAPFENLSWLINTYTFIHSNQLLKFSFRMCSMCNDAYMSNIHSVYMKVFSLGYKPINFTLLMRNCFCNMLKDFNILVVLDLLVYELKGKCNVHHSEHSHKAFWFVFEDTCNGNYFISSLITLDYQTFMHDNITRLDSIMCFEHLHSAHSTVQEWLTVASLHRWLLCVFIHSFFFFFYVQGLILEPSNSKQGSSIMQRVIYIC